jgi:uncharacterized membrane protein
LGGEGALMDDEIKIVSIGLIVVMMGIAVYPVLSAHRVVEPFSELGILGPNGKLGDYPSEVSVGEPVNLYLYVGNQEGLAQYYRVDVKIGDREQNVSDVVALEAPVVASYSLALPSGANTTMPIAVRLSEPGVNRRLVFELHRFDVEVGEFKYQLWAQLWLNVTAVR